MTIQTLFDKNRHSEWKQHLANILKDFYMTDGIIVAVKTHKGSIYP